MQKILSVALVVVMLAALITVFPASAVTSLPQLCVTEVCPDSTGWSAHGSDAGDSFEFIEIYNAGTTDVNLYEYSMVMGEATPGQDPSDKEIQKVNPIQQSGNAAGTIATTNDPRDAGYEYYPTNPATAVLEPGQTAVIWFCQYDAVVAAAYGQKKAITIEDFKNYYRMDKYSEEALEDILVVAVDANGSRSNKTVYTPTEKVGSFNPYGCSSAAYDTTGFDGRFNLYNSNKKVYGIIKTADIVTDAGNPTTTLASCVSYGYANYNDSNVQKNLMYKVTTDQGQPKTGSIADTSYNYFYHNGSSQYENGKFDGNIKMGDWDCVKYVTPGLLHSSQVDSFKALNSTPSDSLTYVQDRVITDPTSIRYTVYQENFFGLEDTDVIEYDPTNVDKYKADTQAFLDKLEWDMTYYLNDGGTVRYYIENEKLICDNLDADLTGDGNIVKGDGDIDSADGVVLAYPSMKMEKIARSDYTIEYEVTYLDANENNRYCGVVYNFNEKTSYDIFILRVSGAGNNQRRIGGSTYTTYDDKYSKHYAANNDTAEGQTSIISKITNGEVKVLGTGVNMWGFDEEQKAQYAPMLGRTLNVRMEINQVTGPAYYINDILVTKAATVLADPSDKNSAVAANPYWGAQTNYGEFAIGFFVSQRVKLAIDNIKVTGWVNEYTEADMLRAYANAESKEPATGDATIYVTIAMAVSFVSLAALVVAKRRSSVK